MEESLVVCFFNVHLQRLFMPVPGESFIASARIRSPSRTQDRDEDNNWKKPYMY